MTQELTVSLSARDILGTTSITNLSTVLRLDRKGSLEYANAWC